MQSETKIVFLNQYAGPLFRELVEDLGMAFGKGELFTGHISEIGRELSPEISVIPCPDQNTGGGIAHNLMAGLYGLRSSQIVARRKIPLLFIVSNPPILPWVGYLVKRLWGQKYVVLVYDVYPDMLVRFAGLSEHSLVARLWRWLNKWAFEHSEVVFAIGDYMAQLLETMYDPARTTVGQTVVIPNWADPEVIHPIDKRKNWFAKKYDQAECLTVLYAGTLGLKHNVGVMIQAAPRLKSLDDVHLMFIGRGAGYDQISGLIEAENLTNTTLMPFLPEKDIPYSLATGDVAVIAVDRGGEGVYVPGKTYYAMAAGSALLVLSDSDNEVTDIVNTYQCGLVVSPDDLDGFIKAVHRFREDGAFLETCRRNVRRTMEAHFSRQVCTQNYIDTLKGLGL